MSLKLTTSLSEISAGELFPTVCIIVQDLHDQLDNEYHQPVNLKIVNLQTKECIHTIVSDTNEGVSTFSNIMVTTSGIFNCIFSSSDMSITKKIKVTPSKKIFIRNSFNENTLKHRSQSLLKMIMKILNYLEILLSIEYLLSQSEESNSLVLMMRYHQNFFSISGTPIFLI